MKTKTLITEISRTLASIEGVEKYLEKKSVAKKIRHLAEDLKDRLKKEPKKKEVKKKEAKKKESEKKETVEVAAEIPAKAPVKKPKAAPAPKASAAAPTKRVQRKVTPKQEITEEEKA